MMVLCLYLLVANIPIGVHGFQTSISTPSSSSSSSSSFLSTGFDSLPSNHQRRVIGGSSSSSSSSTQLQAVSPLTTATTALVSSPLGAVTVLASIVCFHELGHYGAARWLFNMSVVEFSIGFGPKLFGFDALGNEFNVRALPLGGYVRFPENYNVTQVEVQQTNARQAFEQRKQAEKWTWWQEGWNLLTLGGWDAQRKRQKRQKEQQQQQQEQQATKSFWKRLLLPRRRSGPTITITDPEDFEIDYYDDPNLLQNRPWPQRAVVLSGGVIFNMILAFLLYFGEIQYGTGIPQPIFEPGVVISQAPRVQGPSEGILRQGDIIRGINGQAITMSSPTPMGAQQQVSDVIGVIRKTPPGDSIQLQVQRGPQAQKLIQVDVQPQETGSVQSIGVFLGPNFSRMDKIQSDNLVESLRLAYQYLLQTITQTVEGLASLFGMLLMGQGPPPGQQVSGPIGLIKTGTQIVSTRDVGAVVLFAAALSVNLGVINALPLPGLDGGQLLFVVAEAVTGKKVDQRLQEGITSVAILLLLWLSITTAVSDVGSIINGR